MMKACIIPSGSQKRFNTIQINTFALSIRSTNTSPTKIINPQNFRPQKRNNFDDNDNDGPN